MLGQRFTAGGELVLRAREGGLRLSQLGQLLLDPSELVGVRLRLRLGLGLDGSLCCFNTCSFALELFLALGQLGSPRLELLLTFGEGGFPLGKRVCLFLELCRASFQFLVARVDRGGFGRCRRSLC